MSSLPLGGSCEVATYSSAPATVSLYHYLPNPPSPLHTHPMAHLLLPGSRHPLPILTLGLGLSSLFLLTPRFRRPLLCDSATGSTPLTTASESFRTYTRDAKVPVWKDGRVNPGAYRQISSGSLLGGLSLLDLVGWGGVEKG